MKIKLANTPKSRPATKLAIFWRYLKGAHLKHATRKFFKKLRGK